MMLPILDPLFNVREVCKQLVLLEDHLLHPAKRCPDCIRKHLLTAEALAEEAVSLNSDPALGPMLTALPGQVRALWRAAHAGQDLVQVAHAVRMLRKKLVPTMIGVKVAARYLDAKKIKVKRKDTGKVVQVSEETLKGPRGGDYEEVRDSEGGGHEKVDLHSEGFRTTEEEPEFEAHWGNSKKMKAWEREHVVTLPGGSVVAGTPHFWEGDEAQAFIQERLIPQVTSTVEKALKAGKKVVFLAEGRLLKDPEGEVPENEWDEQYEVARALQQKFGDKVDRTTWDEGSGSVITDDNTVDLNTPMGKELVERSGGDSDLVEAAVYAMQYGQGNADMVLGEGAKRGLKKLGIDPKDKDALYNTSFPEDTGGGPTPISRVTHLFNDMRDEELVRKVRALDAQGTVAIVTPGASHAYSLKPVLEKGRGKKAGENPCRRQHYQEERCPLPEGLLEQIHHEYLGKILGYAVWRIRGTVLRDNLDVGFTMGGNPARYGYQPHREFWIDDELVPQEVADTLFHEVIETHRMTSFGECYDDAHQAANDAEEQVRHLREKVTSWEEVIPHVERWISHFHGQRVAARYKNKKKVPKADGDGTTTVYEYSDRQVALRNSEKAKRIEKLRKQMSDLRNQVTKDLDAKDDRKRLTALAVALMDETYERVGNEDSAEERGHFGVTTWLVKHVTLGPKKATIRYTGKSGVKQEKEVTTPKVLAALRAAVEDKGEDEQVLCKGEECHVLAEDVNEYLQPYDITAKDIRGLHANEEMKARLKAVRGNGGKLPEDKKEREKKLKDEFKQALEEAAEAVGHEPSTLRSQYLVPSLEESYVKDGTIIDRLDKKGSVHPVVLWWKDMDEAKPTEPPLCEDPEQCYWVDTCPVCGNREIMGCRCQLSERRCANGHQWVWCEVHHVRVVLPEGKNVHGTIPWDGCRCGAGTPVAPRTKTAGAFTDYAAAKVRQDREEALRRAAAMGLTLEEWQARAAEVMQAWARRTATKTPAEKEDEEIERLVRPSPKLKPPRNDLRRERIRDEDTDPDEGKDKDLSMNFKDIGASRVASRWRCRTQIREFLAADEPKKDTLEEHAQEQGKKDYDDYRESHPDTELDVAHFIERAKKRLEREQQRSTEKKPTKKRPSKLVGPEGKPVEVEEEDTEATEKQKQEEEAADKEELAKAEEEAKKKKVQEAVESVAGVAEKLVKDTSLPESFRKDLEKQMGEMNAKQRADFAESYQSALSKYLDNPPDSDSARKEAQKVRKAKMPTDPKKIGKHMAQMLYADRVTYNPLLVGKTKLSDDTEPIKDGDQGRHEAQRKQKAIESYLHFTKLEPGERQEMAGRLAEDLKGVNPESPRGREMRAIYEGMVLAAAVKGEDPPEVEGDSDEDVRLTPPRSDHFYRMVKVLQKSGRETMLLGTASNVGSLESRRIMQDAVNELEDKDLDELIPEGHPVRAIYDGLMADAEGDQDEGPGKRKVKKPKLSTQDRAYLRELVNKAFVDGFAFMEPLTGEYVEANGEKATTERVTEIREKADAKVGGKVHKRIKSFTDMSPEEREEKDENGMTAADLIAQEVRTSRLQGFVKFLRKMFPKRPEGTASEARANAVEKGDLDALQAEFRTHLRMASYDFTPWPPLHE